MIPSSSSGCYADKSEQDFRLAAQTSPQGDLGKAPRRELGGLGAVGEHQPAQQANEDQVDQSEGHSGRSCWLWSGRRC